MATEVLSGFTNDFVLFPTRADDAPLSSLPFSSFPTYSSTPSASASPLDTMASSTSYPHDFSMSAYYDPFAAEPGLVAPAVPSFYGTPRSQAAEDGAQGASFAHGSHPGHLAAALAAHRQYRPQGPSSHPSPSVLALDQQHPPQAPAFGAAPSGPSTASSAVGSPYSQAQSLPPVAPAGPEQWFECGTADLGLNMGLGVAGLDGYARGGFPLTSGEMGDAWEGKFGFVDPTLLSTFDRAPTLPAPTSPFPGFAPAPYAPPIIQPPSPAPSDVSSHHSHRDSLITRNRHASPYIFNPYPTTAPASRMPYRRGSISSHSRFSHDSPRAGSLDGEHENRERDRCPHPECGKHFKDLKAHMLTHMSERPEKCPIVSCDYHTKGFARKYDRCRHTLTHYKGTMVCDFCPNSGSAVEKSFNRADVFKRHLTSVHGVEQSPPNARKKTPTSGAASVGKKAGTAASTGPQQLGKCSTCSSTFASAQDFYDHLDDCVLRYLDRGEPSERINEQRLQEVADDAAVRETLARNRLPLQDEQRNATDGGARDAEGDDDDADADADGQSDEEASS